MGRTRLPATTSTSALQELRDALGKAKLLAIGVSDYDKASGFDNLPQCSNDALALRDVYRDHWQLNPDADYLQTLVSGTKRAPSRGAIFSETKRLAEIAEDDDRLVFFFSGHGQRLEDEFFLVPGDAYADDDPTALVRLGDIVKILKSSCAKHVILFLDACLSGSVASGRKLAPAKISKRYLKEYLSSTRGLAVVTASCEDQASYTQSPNPKLSLFSHYLVKALAGEPDALDEDGFLTLDSLHQYVGACVERKAKSYQKCQKPTVDVQSSGTLVIADYSQSIIDPAAFDPGEFPLESLTVEEWEGFRVDEVLTSIRRWSAYSTEYLADRVNAGLAEHLEDRLGQLVADLVNDLKLPISEVAAEDTELVFPGGRLVYTYEADDKKTGRLVGQLVLDTEWITNPGRMQDLLECLGFSPERISVELSKRVDPQSLLAGLKANGWRATSIRSHRIEASNGKVSLAVEPTSLIFEGLTIAEMFGLDGDEKQRKLAYGATPAGSRGKPVCAARAACEERAPKERCGAGWLGGAKGRKPPESKGHDGLRCRPRHGKPA